MQRFSRAFFSTMGRWPVQASLLLATVASPVLAAPVYITDGDRQIVDGEDPEGHVTGTRPSPWQIDDGLYVGYYGIGTLDIDNRGEVSTSGTSALVLGVTDGSDGRVSITGDGSLLDVTSGATRIGQAGQGTITVTGGGRFESNGLVEIADSADGEGHVSVSGEGSTFVTTGNAPTYIGSSGTGTLDIVDGGGVTSAVLATVGRRLGSNGQVLVQGVGSTWSVQGNLKIGESGEGTVVLANGGTTDLGDGNASHVFLGTETDGSGTLVVGAAVGETPAAAGTLKARSLNFQAGTGELVFNHTDDDYVFDLDLQSDLLVPDPSIGNHSIAHLAGHTTYTGDGSRFEGDTTVSGGALHVDGALGGALRVLADATLGGSGTVGSTTIASGGVLAPGNSIGTLTVDGDLVFESGSFYDVEVNPENNDSDHVHVTGSATLAGSVLHVGNDGDYQPFTEYTIVSADGGIVGQFEAVQSRFAFLDADLNYQAHEVMLALQRNDTTFDSVARTRNQRAVAGAIDTLPVDHAVYQDIVTENADDAPAAFERYSGDSLVAGPGATDRLIGQFGERLRQRDQGGGARTLTGDAHNGLWLSTGAFDSEERHDHDTGNAAYQLNGEQLTLGLDRTLPGGRVGLAAGRVQGRLDFDRRGDKGELDGWLVGTYGHHDITPTLYARADLSYGEIDHDHQRGIGTEAWAHSDSTVKAVRVALESGLRLHAGHTEVRPYAQVAMTRLKRDGFQEHGAGAANLDLAGTTLRRGEAALGVGLGRSLQRAHLHADLAAIQPFGDTESNQQARFADAGDTFTVYGADRDDPRLRARVGGALRVAPGIDLSLAYQVRADDQGNEQLGDLGVSWRW